MGGGGDEDGEEGAPGGDLRHLDLGGEHVTIIGGGLTAGHLAVGAVTHGATVTLVARRPLREQLFDTDPGWLGPRHLDAFRRVADPARRHLLAAGARDGGSMPPWMARRLGALRDAGELRVLAPGRICGAHRAHDRVDLVLGDETRLRTDRPWLATGTRPDLTADRITTGLQHLRPTRVVEGFPELDDHLRWPGTDVHIVGRLATLSLGPAAGNLWGARTAATTLTCHTVPSNAPNWRS